MLSFKTLFAVLCLLGLSATPALIRADTMHPVPEIKPIAGARPANSSPNYQTLRSISADGDAFNVEGVTLKRDAGELTLRKGTVYLYPPVNGHITGAVFLGEGSFHLLPPTAAEQKSLSRLTKSNDMNQDFNGLVLRFTDSTAEELRKTATGAAAGRNSTADGAAAGLVKAFRKKINLNLDARILQDVLSDKPGGLFLASFKGSGLFGRSILYMVDPQGAPAASPEQVELATYTNTDFEVWAAFDPATPPEPRLYGNQIHVTDQTLDVTIDKTGKLSASAITTFTAQHEKVLLVPLNLHRKLRVSGVYGPTGVPLDFIQEGPEDDPQFSIQLAEPLAQGKSISIRTDYSGKDVVYSEGEGNYYPAGDARESWYPNGSEGLGGYSNFHMTFHVPKGVVAVATGERVSADDKGASAVSVWQTDAPIAVAGFNLGEFKEVDSKSATGVGIEAYANNSIPEWAKRFEKSGILGSMSTTVALKQTVQQADTAVDIYTNFFGPLPYNHVALTQQTACNYGQSWPMLVYLPTCAFWDTTILEDLGLLQSDRTYWTTVLPHEVAHQWWGQTVGFSSYRDQWMSEGFANFSASLYLLYTEPDMKSYREYWSLQRHRILDKNANGVRPIDAGAITMGYRLNNEKSGENIYSMLVYSKGAYVLHMLEMLYWTPEAKEEPLKKSLHEFVSTYKNRAATTEDFKATLERSMPRQMDIDGNKRLDWFFNAYVYGTALPHYDISSEFTKNGDADAVHLKLTQSNVTDDFHMLVPVYIDLGNGKISRLFNVSMKGNKTLDTTVKLGKLPSPAKRLLVNYNYDVLSDN
jgi:hypothetical protein